MQIVSNRKQILLLGVFNRKLKLASVSLWLKEKCTFLSFFFKHVSVFNSLQDGVTSVWKWAQGCSFSLKTFYDFKAATFPSMSREQREADLQVFPLTLSAVSLVSSVLSGGLLGLVCAVGMCFGCSRINSLFGSNLLWAECVFPSTLIVLFVTAPLVSSHFPVACLQASSAGLFPSVFICSKLCFVK